MYRRRVATPAHDYQAIVDAMAELVTEAERSLGAQGSVGICTPGALSQRTGLLKNSNTQCLNGRTPHLDLGARLGREIRLENDANCFALSEAVDGVGRGAPLVFGVILGTGVGGGIVVHGRCLVGCNAIAGEWGHIPLPYPDASDLPAPPCYCGRAGCVETYLCGRGLREDHARHSGEQRSADEIAARASAGDAAAQLSIERYAERLARALSLVINVLDPHVIALGGGLSQIEALYQLVPAALPRYVFSDEVATRVLRAEHGDSSGVRGAAWLW